MAFKEKLDTGSGDSVKFNKIGDSVTGVYLGSQLDPNGKFGPTTKHFFRTKEGMRTVWAKPTSQLGQMLNGEEGNNLKVTFAETKPSGKGNPTKIFKVAIDEDFERLAPEYLMTVSTSDDSEYAEETPAPAPTKSSREDILNRLSAAKRK
jgi:hypothetical protein